MNVAFDTHVILRLLVPDNPAQVTATRRLAAEAKTIALPLITLCEAVWTLRRFYKLPSVEIADALAEFLSDERVRADFAAVEAGLAQLRAGGDFADAVIALEGQRLGADTLATFDKGAVKLLERRGVPVTLLESDSLIFAHSPSGGGSWRIRRGGSVQECAGGR